MTRYCKERNHEDLCIIDDIADLPAVVQPVCRQKDAAGCKDTRSCEIAGYFIAGCAESEANFDFETVPGKTPRPSSRRKLPGSLLHTQPELKSKPGRAQILSSFEKAVKQKVAPSSA